VEPDIFAEKRGEAVYVWFTGWRWTS